MKNYTIKILVTVLLMTVISFAVKAQIKKEKGCNLQVYANVKNAACDTCSNGSATAFTVNGLPPYSWTWYTSPLQTTQTITGLKPGTYIVCVTDAKGCSACDSSVYIDSTNCSSFKIFVGSADASCDTCADGYAWVGDSIHGGTPPYSYIWSTTPAQTTNAVNGLLPGSYQICAKDYYGCITCDSVKIKIAGCNLQLNTSKVNATCDTCSNGSATAYPENGKAPYTWTWNTTPVQTTQTATGLKPGKYSVCITDARGCSACNNSVFIDSTRCAGFFISPGSVDATCDTCANGYAWVSDSIHGGTPPYSYTWSTTPVQITNAINGLLPGTYQVCVKDLNGCIACDSVIITNKGCNLKLSTTVKNASCDTCHNGFATESVWNGLQPYTWSWNTSPVQHTETASHLIPGIYSVCVTDARGCSACNNSVVIDSTGCKGFKILASSAKASCNYCADGSAWVRKDSIRGGTSPYSYTWFTNPVQNSDTAKELLPGTYEVCVKDFYGCTACETISVEIPPCSAHFEIYPTSTPHVYNAVNMASGVSPLKYYWTWGDGSNDTTELPIHKYDSAGFYKICLKINDINGCEDSYCNSYYLMKANNPIIEVDVIPYNVYIGINEIKNNKSINVYPNPANSLLIVSYSFLEKSKLRIGVYDIMGREIISQKLEIKSQKEKDEIKLDLSGLSNGVYILNLQNEKENYVRKIIISH